jgi:hypothetical protein
MSQAGIMSTDSDSGGAALGWQPDEHALWYEVLRCDASSGPCSLHVLRISTDISIVDDAAAGLYHRYRVFAVTDPEQPNELCGHGLYCSLPFAQCVGAGRCSVYDEFCETGHVDPVCGCSGSTYTSACFAGADGASLRHSGSCLP